MNLKSFMGFLVIGERRIFLEITEIVKIAKSANEITIQMLRHLG